MILINLLQFLKRKSFAVIVLSCLYRFGLVFCDPVIACLSVTPVLLINNGSEIMDEYKCFQNNTEWNTTYDCIKNRVNLKLKKFRSMAPTPSEREDIFYEIVEYYFLTQVFCLLLLILLFFQKQ